MQNTNYAFIFVKHVTCIQLLRSFFILLYLAIFYVFHNIAYVPLFFFEEVPGSVLSCLPILLTKHAVSQYEGKYHMHEIFFY